MQHAQKYWDDVVAVYSDMSSQSNGIFGMAFWNSD